MCCAQILEPNTVHLDKVQCESVRCVEYLKLHIFFTIGLWFIFLMLLTYCLTAAACYPNTHTHTHARTHTPTHTHTHFPYMHFQSPYLFESFGRIPLE